MTESIVKVVALEQSLSHIQQQLTMMSDQLKALTTLQNELIRQQTTMDTHRGEIERATRAIERHVAEFSKWREAHEIENRAVADRVTTFRGVLLGFGVLATLLTGMVVATAKQWVDSAAVERARIERTIEQLRSEHDARLDVLEKPQ